MAIVVPVVTTFDAKGISKAISNFKKLEGSAAKTGFALRAVDQGITSFGKQVAKAGAIAVAAAGAIGFAFVKSAMEAQAEQQRLTQILLTTGAATEDQVKSLLAQADALEKVGVASAGNITTAQSQLATFDLQFETIQKLTPAIADYVIAEKGASASAADFKAMTNGLAQALNGNFMSLTKSGFVLDDTTKALISNGTEAERAAALVDVLSSTYGGFNEAAAQTAEGRLIVLKNSFNALRTEIGIRLIPIFEKLVAFLQTSVMPFLMNLIAVFDERGLKGVMQEVVGSFHNFISEGGKVRQTIVILTGVILAFKLGMIAFGIATTVTTVLMMAFGATAKAASAAAAPIALIAFAIVAVGVALVLAYIRFEGFRKVVNAVINFVIGYFEDMINAWISAINIFIKAANAVNGLLGKIGIKLPVVGEIGKVSFGRIGDAAKKATGEVRKLSTGVNDLQDGAAAGIVGKKFKRASDDDTGGGGGGESALDKAKRQLKEYTDGLNSAKDAQNSLKSSSKALADAQKGVITAGRGVTDAQDAFIASGKAVVEAQDAVKQASLNITSAQKGLEASTQEVAKAQAHFNSVSQGYGASSREGLKQLRSVQDAQRSLADANRSVADSVRGVTAAEEKLKRLREGPTARNVEDAEIGLQKKKFDVEESIFAIASAEADLAELRTSGKATPMEIRKAEIRLEEAKYKVREANLAVMDSEKQLVTLRTNTPTLQEIADAERALEDAKLSVVTASLRESDAQLSLNDETALYNEIVFGAKEGTERYNDALELLTDAKEKELKATTLVIEALEKEEEAIAKVEEAKRKQEDAADGIIKALEDEQEAIEKVTSAQDDLRNATYAVLDAEKALKAFRKNIPKEIREQATEKFIRRSTVNAPGVVIPGLPVIEIPSFPDFSDPAIMNPQMAVADTTVIINAPSLDPSAAQGFVYDALIQYQRFNGPLEFQIAS